MDWKRNQYILEEILASLYCQNYLAIFDGEDVDRSTDPSFIVLIQILNFFQAFRTLERTLFRHQPLPLDESLFDMEIGAPSKGDTP